MQLINPPECPPQNPSFSQAAISGDTVYLAGQIGIVPASGQLVSQEVGEQTARIFDNARLVLAAAGSSLDRVVRVTVFMVDLAEWAAMNVAYEGAFGGHAPPKTTVEVRRLALDARVEIDFIAER